MPQKRRLQVRMEPDLNRGEPAMCGTLDSGTMFSRHGVKRSCPSDDCIAPKATMLEDTVDLYRDLLKPKRARRRGSSRE